ncbi:hypothetical protein CAI21_04120 [Alkalilimnicola ehrlichii]|uniref:Isoprenylcysteine carboxyl methyltransferase n=1 Tax=Alkalilimnicola ehrlichii TaxID=351052 RepID=A0A3E0X1S4_9GAMM|nr:isoprenylcysteine carboxylmethyltransferase family protein [Alkalilimnicola ehrlichii]RFA30705.1 hypothetical protein CAI21_04120 [Alkalilimnicola ehrlichii]RFA38282.1 hypothetical protein CAL65_05485 [Alkalilimnicola ehrlichii]
MKKLRALFPLLIALAGLIALLAVGVYSAARADGAHSWGILAVVLLYAVWILSEFRITRGEAKRDIADDNGTCELYAVARFLTMLTALAATPLWQGFGLWYAVGLSLFLCGALFRSYAIRSLGRCYSHRVRTPEQEAIISNGPYRYMRHPAYSGMLLAHIGILVLFFSWPLLAVFGLVFLPALVYRIRVEEGHLLQIPDYAAYAKGRKRLAPGLW